MAPWSASSDATRSNLYAKATLYNSFGSKEDLVRAYLEQHLRNRQKDIGRIVSAHATPRSRILGVFAELGLALTATDFRGCRFIMATAEARPGDAGEVTSAEYRAWLLNLFTELASAAGARNPVQLGRRLLLLYDGGAVAARNGRGSRGRRSCDALRRGGFARCRNPGQAQGQPVPVSRAIRFGFDTVQS